MMILSVNTDVRITKLTSFLRCYLLNPTTSPDLAQKLKVVSRKVDILLLIP